MSTRLEFVTRRPLVSVRQGAAVKTWRRGGSTPGRPAILWGGGAPHSSTNDQLEPFDSIRLFQDLGELSSNGADPIQIESCPMEDKKSLDVGAIALPPRHRLEDDKVLGEHDRYAHSGKVFDGGSTEGFAFEG